MARDTTTSPDTDTEPDDTPHREGEEVNREHRYSDDWAKNPDALADYESPDHAPPTADEEIEDKGDTRNISEEFPLDDEGRPSEDAPSEQGGPAEDVELEGDWDAFQE